MSMDDNFKIKHNDTKSDTSFKLNEKEELKEFLSSPTNEANRNKSPENTVNNKLTIKELNEKAKKMNFNITDFMNVIPLSIKKIENNSSIQNLSSTIKEFKKENSETTNRKDSPSIHLKECKQKSIERDSSNIIIIEESPGRKGIKNVIINHDLTKTRDEIERPEEIKGKIDKDNPPPKKEYKVSYLDFIKKSDTLATNNKNKLYSKGKPQNNITNSTNEKKEKKERIIKYSQKTREINNAQNHLIKENAHVIPIKKINKINIYDSNPKENMNTRNKQDRVQSSHSPILKNRKVNSSLTYEKPNLNEFIQEFHSSSKKPTFIKLNSTNNIQNNDEVEKRVDKDKKSDENKSYEMKYKLYREKYYVYKYRLKKAKNIISKLRKKKKNNKIEENLPENEGNSLAEYENMQKITGLKHSENIEYLLSRFGEKENLIEILEEKFIENETAKYLVDLVNKIYEEHLSFKRNSEKMTEIQSLKMNELENLIQVIQSNQAHATLTNDTIDVSYESNESL